NQGFEKIDLEVTQSGIMTISLNRPEKMNAINKKMIEELLKVIEMIENDYSDQYKVVIIRGNGRGFCSGGDLQEFEQLLKEGDKTKSEQYIALLHWFARRWYELPLPTIACIHGPVAGGGASLSLLSDIRLAE